MPQQNLFSSPAVPAILQGDGFIRQSRLVPNLLPFSKATLWRKVKRKEFPSPVKLSRGVTAWHVPEVRAWLLSCAGHEA